MGIKVLEQFAWQDCVLPVCVPKCVLFIVQDCCGPAVTEVYIFWGGGGNSIQVVVVVVGMS